MTRNERDLPIELLMRLVRLDINTGLLYWLRRDKDMFSDSESRSAEHKANNWNSQYAGKQAFTALHRGRYFVGAINCANFFAHRVAFAVYHGKWPQFFIDHIDGNGFNNRPSNLRDVQHCENMRNVKMHKDNSTGFIGVSFSKSINKYEARIHVNGRPLVIGYFDTPEAAGAARRSSSQSHCFHENHGRKQ